MKVMAMYLPQFHRIPENDRWWGEGFTDWTAVKGAECLYDGHIQPRVPLYGNYYDLIKHDTLVWQADLMKKYHIDGMCIYHYWFENGRRILEKPVENLLKWTDISMPFCFCWANETWSRTWKKLSGSNVWSSIYEIENGRDDNGILLKQEYGREKDWERHFNYLLPFFLDERYIRLNEKPVFVIYKPSKIYSLWNMVDCFNKLARKNGLSGLYVIGMEENSIFGLDGVCARQPYYAMTQSSKEYDSSNLPLVTYSYDELWEIIHRQKRFMNPTYLCGFVDYDSSPRMGREGSVVKGTSPEKFYQNFKKLYEKSMLLGNEFLFINAWNEWGEGMYLEPDEKNGYAYLESLSRAIVECKSNHEYKESDRICELDVEEGERKALEQVRRRHDDLLDNWMHLRDINIDFSAYFKKYGYHTVGIYGAGKLGTHLFYELKNTDIQVLFGIDKNCEAILFPVNVYSPDQQLPKADVIIITVIDKYGEISKLIDEKINCPMVPLEEIIQELI